MLDLLKSLFTSKVFGTLSTRLVNRFTTGGVILVISQLVNLNILPKGTVESVDGLSNGDLIPYVIIAVGIWLIFTKGNVFFKGVANVVDVLHVTEKEKKQKQIDLLELDVKILELNQQIADLKKNKRGNKIGFKD